MYLSGKSLSAIEPIDVSKTTLLEIFLGSGASACNTLFKTGASLNPSRPRLSVSKFSGGSRLENMKKLSLEKDVARRICSDNRSLAVPSLRICSFSVK